MSKSLYSLSVHQLVDFLLRRGDIDNRIYNDETMKMGTKIHSLYQKQSDTNYISEYLLNGTFELDDAVFKLNGRADGLILNNDYPIIDEIKSTVIRLEDFYSQQHKWHLGQAECYALMYADLKNLDKVGIRLTYISQINTKDILIKDFVYTRQELIEKVYGYCREYLEFDKLHLQNIQARDKSIKKVSFPYENLRKGQEDLINFVTSNISASSIGLAQAPTGIGKTVSTLYPSILSLKHNKVDKIFYLTAKGTGRETAYDTMTELYKNGFVGKDSYIVAKDKICFCPGKECNPDQCPYAKGYYDKIKSLMIEGLESEKRFDIEYVTNMARKNFVCPHELQLDLSLFSDVIVCDVNYFFDPVVKLQRYFGDDKTPDKYVVLIDEAHNLVDRGRNIFSQKLVLSNAINAYKSIEYSDFKSLKKALKTLIEYLEKLQDEMSATYTNLDGMPAELIKNLENLKRCHKDVSKKNNLGYPREYITFYLDARRFLLLANDFYNDSYQLFGYKENNSFELNMFCLNCGDFLSNEFHRVKSTTLFSATLSPMEYYAETLFEQGENVNKLLLSSPFPKENMNLMIAPKVSVRYKDRDKTYAEVACYLKRFVDGKMGNYFLYFPSYEYMFNIAPYLDFSDNEVLMQNKDMNDDEKALFLSNFRSNPLCTTVGLLVLGGAFSEGIDLVSDRLIGVAVVGIGFPQVNHVNELIKNYEDKLNGHGFSHAYTDPGMNKVTQAVGRLIRSDTDKGSVLLLDDRYLRGDYRELFAENWGDYEVTLTPNEVSKKISLFYKK